MKIPPNKNELTEVTIEDFTKSGEGIGHVGGYTLFVKNALIGDTVSAKITRPKKTYAYARAEEIISPSPDRVSAPCPAARACGGCTFQEYAYPAQLRWKKDYVKSVLTRIGGFPDMDVRDVMGMKKPYRSRNKAQYPVAEVKGRIVWGFYASRTHSIIENEDCLLTEPRYGEVMKRVAAFMNRYGVSAYDENTHTGLVRHVLIRSARSTGELMVCPVLNGTSLPHADRLTEMLKDVDGLRCICLNINEKKGNAILGSRTVPLYGDPWITDVLMGLRFRISPRSFYQVNPSQTEALYGEVVRAASLTGNEVVYDLYCGIGTISLVLAGHAKNVIGVEIIPDAVRDAGENARRNGIENAEFYAGAAEELLTEETFERNPRFPRPDVVVLDPPRKGCDESLIRTVRKMKPRRIVYVSCDPATLARDLRLFAEGDDPSCASYMPAYIQPVDMFCMSPRVECVARLDRAERSES